MSKATPVEKIRAAIANQLSAYGAQDVESTHETILIRNGLFCGRKFQCDRHEVVWFIEEDEIKFFGPCGDLLKAVSALGWIQEFEQSQPSSARIDQETAPERRAA